MGRTSSRHAVDIARLSPAIAARRTLDIASSTPLAATITLSKIVSEKSLAFSASWIDTALAVMRLQLRLFGALATNTAGANTWNLRTTMNEGEKIARKTLAPIAKQVRRNSRSR